MNRLLAIGLSGCLKKDEAKQPHKHKTQTHGKMEMQKDKKLHRQRLSRQNKSPETIYYISVFFVINQLLAI